MARIENIATALPPYVVEQSLARDAYTMLFAGTPSCLLSLGKEL